MNARRRGDVSMMADLDGGGGGMAEKRYGRKDVGTSTRRRQDTFASAGGGLEPGKSARSGRGPDARRILSAATCFFSPRIAESWRHKAAISWDSSAGRPLTPGEGRREPSHGVRWLRPPAKLADAGAAPYYARAHSLAPPNSGILRLFLNKRGLNRLAPERWHGRCVSWPTHRGPTAIFGDPCRVWPGPMRPSGRETR